MKKPSLKVPDKGGVAYGAVIRDITSIIATARGLTVRSVNCIMTATYWLIGRRIVEHEQSGHERAAYGEDLVVWLSADLTAKYGRGFAKSNLYQMRAFYQAYAGIFQTVSGKSTESSKHYSTDGLQTQNNKDITPELSMTRVAQRFPLPWSAYVRLLTVKNDHARQFYETEALRGGWSVRQLDRQIDSQFYERTALSRNKTAMLSKGQKSDVDNEVSPDESIKDPYVLEFLDLKDEYSETDLENALIQRMETFLLELGRDFCFVGRQKRLRIGDEWYRVDLLLFHRRLRCLVIMDLKLGKFTHSDVGQMHLYLNYAQANWTHDGENPPVGLILCTRKDEAVARYALDRLPNKVLAAEYRTTLPDEKKLAAEIERARSILENRKAIKSRKR